MKTGLAIGLNAVNPDAYKGWSGELVSPCFDARDRAAGYAQHGFQVFPLLNEHAYLDAARDHIISMAATCNASDSALIAFSGHASRYSTPFFGSRETLCFYDGQMADSELLSLLARFKPGVRVIVEIDACHGGGFDRSMRGGGRTRSMPRDFTKIVPPPEFSAQRAQIKASVLILTACEADELAGEDWSNGFYTGTSLEARDAFPNVPTFRQWFTMTQSLMLQNHPSQHPVAHRLGVDDVWETPIS